VPYDVCGNSERASTRLKKIERQRRRHTDGEREREGGREERRTGGREGRSEGGREGGREGEREREKEKERQNLVFNNVVSKVNLCYKHTRTPTNARAYQSTQHKYAGNH